MNYISPHRTNGAQRRRDRSKLGQSPRGEEGIAIHYEGRGESHFFWSPDVIGFLIEDTNLATAFELIEPTINAIINANGARQHYYQVTTNISQLEAAIERSALLQLPLGYAVTTQFVARCDLKLAQNASI